MPPAELLVFICVHSHLRHVCRGRILAPHWLPARAGVKGHAASRADAAAARFVVPPEPHCGEQSLASAETHTHTHKHTHVHAHTRTHTHTHTFCSHCSHILFLTLFTCFLLFIFPFVSFSLFFRDLFFSFLSVSRSLDPRCSL